MNEIEVLTTGLSRKIWQKLSILDNLGPEHLNNSEELREHDKIKDNKI